MINESSGILRNVSLDWKNVLRKIRIVSNDVQKGDQKIKSENIRQASSTNQKYILALIMIQQFFRWRLTPAFPMCQRIDISQYDEFKNTFPPRHK